MSVPSCVAKSHSGVCQGEGLVLSVFVSTVEDKAFVVSPCHAVYVFYVGCYICALLVWAIVLSEYGINLSFRISHVEAVIVKF